MKVTLPIETPVIHVPLSRRVGETLPHKSYSSWSWEDQTANGHLHGQSPRSGFAVIGPFEPMPSGTGIAPPRCHPPPDGGTLRHVNNSLPGPVSEGLVHGNGSRQPDNWLSALAEPFVTILAHGNGVNGCFPLCMRELCVAIVTRWYTGQPDTRLPSSPASWVTCPKFHSSLSRSTAVYWFGPNPKGSGDCSFSRCSLAA